MGVNLRKAIKDALSKHQIKKAFAKNHSSIIKIMKVKNTKYVVVGKKVKVHENARIECYDEFRGQSFKPSLIIGDGVIIGNNFTALVTNTCRIGSNSVFAHNVSIIDENHGIDPESVLPYHAQPLNSKSITIGSNCWVGCNVTFLAGAKIGDNVVVGAGSVVNKRFGDNVIIAGVPARVIKVFDESKHEWVKYNDRI